MGGYSVSITVGAGASAVVTSPRPFGFLEIPLLALMAYHIMLGDL